jgi:hypothetical protein
MIDTASSILGNRMQLQRDEMSMSIMKKRMQAEQAMALMLMEAARNVEQFVGSSSCRARGSIVDIYA